MDTMKKLVAMILALTMALSLVGCSSSSKGDSSSSSSGGGDGKTYTVAYSCIADSIAAFTSILRQDLEEQCTAKGWNFNYLAAEGDVELQAEQVTQLLAQDPDVLVVYAGDASLSPMYVQEANDKGIPVILIMCSIPEEYQDMVYAYVGSDMYACSYDQATRMVDKYGADAGLLVVSVSGVESQQDYQDKLAGFKAGIADTNWTFIDPTYCQSSRDAAQTAMETYLATYGDSIDVVIGFDDDLTMGCVNAIDEAGLTGQIDVYSQMGMAEMVEAIKEGRATETLALPASLNVAAIIQTIQDCLDGKKLDSWEVNADYLFVNADNADDYTPDF
jgi:ribose transport system substrate-binding protein